MKKVKTIFLFILIVAGFLGDATNFFCFFGFFFFFFFFFFVFFGFFFFFFFVFFFFFFFSVLFFANGVGCRATARLMGVGLNTILRHLKNSGRSQ
ncbi:colicin release lysis protein [Klebsiella pneumoniae]|uniref:IS1-like element transposase n=1 Tax=Klebsiella pneumoniae TaxID=573 RepID=UPI003970A6C3